jgi:hypothetical protein
VVRRLQHHEKTSFSRAVKSIVTMENENKIISKGIGGCSSGGTS